MKIKISQLGFSWHILDQLEYLNLKMRNTKACNRCFFFWLADQIPDTNLLIGLGQSETRSLLIDKRGGNSSNYTQTMVLIRIISFKGIIKENTLPFYNRINNSRINLIKLIPKQIFNKILLGTNIKYSSLFRLGTKFSTLNTFSMEYFLQKYLFIIFRRIFST